MREIKFRAYYKNKMWYGNEDNELEEQYGNFVSNINTSFEQPDIIWMQFTWLFDKNGKEIYEGDIVKVYDNDIAKIVFEKCIIVWKTKSHDYMLCNMEWSDFEIIWNIYENPELLKP